MKILKIQKSKRELWETKLTKYGLISNRTPVDAQAYEMVINFYEAEQISPTKSIIVIEKHYEGNILKYGIEALLKGVELTSIFSVLIEPGDKTIDYYKKDVEAIAYSIVAKMEQETFFNKYDPEKMRKYIETKMLALKDKFNIEPK